MTGEKITDEKALEGVAGGGFNEPSPVQSRPCPCGGYILFDCYLDRVQCPDCGRWFRIVNGMPIEENQG